MALKPYDPVILNYAGLMLYYAGQYDQVESLYQHSLSILEKAVGKEHPDVATSVNNLALLYLAQGKFDQAEPLSNVVWQ